MKLYEVYLLLEKYRKEFVDKLIIKYRNEVGESFNEDEALENIDFFDKYNEKLPKEKRNLQEYTYKDLVNAVNSIKSNTKVKKEVEVDFLDTKLIYKNNSLQVYSGDSEKACVAIRGDSKTEWCIATPQNNQYNTYRYGEKEPSFYFIKNLDRLNKIQELEEDPYSFFIIERNKENQFIVTDALNNGQNEKSWEEILEIEPLLNGKEDLFKHKPLNDGEKENYQRFKNGIPYDEYEKLSFQEKQIYISIYNILSDEQFEVTPNELINYYITIGSLLTNEQLNFIKDKPSLLKNYRRVTIKTFLPKYEKGIIKDFEFGNRIFVLTDDEAIDLYNKKKITKIKLLLFKPNLIKYFDVKKINLNNYQLVELLSQQPSLITYFKDNIKDLEYDDMVLIIVNNPITIKYFEEYLEFFEKDEILNILVHEPSLIEKFNDKLNDFDFENDDIIFILSYQPSLIEKFKNELGKLEINDIIDILEEQPSLIEYFKDKLGKIEKNQIRDILQKQPSLIEIFKNELVKLELNDIVFILISQPSLIDYFENILFKFNNEYIKFILEKQPQLKPYFDNIRPINENKKMKLYNILLEQIELFEISQKIIDKLIEKFKIEEPSASDENIKFYIDEFEKRKGNPSITKKDIQTYTFKELEKVIDSLPTNQKISKSDNNVEFSNTELIYNQSPLQIYHGSNEKTCIKIKGDFPSSWCVSRSTGGNMYNTYRYAGTEPSFYFVKNLERLNKITEIKEDLFCFFVIQFNNKGKYIVTNAKNDGDREMSWEEILKLEPLLQGKEGLFKNVPLTDEEKEYNRRFKDGISDEDYINLPYKEKKIYISIKHNLNYKKFINTPKDLINDYITTGVALTQEQFDFIKDKQSLVNNYRRVTIDIVIPEYIKERVNNVGSRWLVLTDEEALELYKKKPRELSAILSYKPQLIEKFDYILPKFEHLLTTNDIKDILSRQPQLIERFEDRLNRLDKNNISDILSAQPQLIEKFENRLSGLTTNNISDILSAQPQLIEKFENRISGLTTNNISVILSNKPQLIEKFENRLSGLNNYDISLILMYQPQLFQKFEKILVDENELNSDNVKNILFFQPQLIDKFENLLSKLEVDDITNLLSKQPQLKPYFDKIKKINENRKLKLLNLI
jgi:hypothetical protein